MISFDRREIESSYYFTHLHEESQLLYKWVFVKHGLYSPWESGPRAYSFLKHYSFMT